MSRILFLLTVVAMLFSTLPCFAQGGDKGHAVDNAPWVASAQAWVCRDSAGKIQSAELFELQVDISRKETPRQILERIIKTTREQDRALARHLKTALRQVRNRIKLEDSLQLNRTGSIPVGVNCNKETLGAWDPDFTVLHVDADLFARIKNSPADVAGLFLHEALRLMAERSRLIVVDSAIESEVRRLITGQKSALVLPDRVTDLPTVNI